MSDVKVIPGIVRAALVNGADSPILRRLARNVDAMDVVSVHFDAWDELRGNVVTVDGYVVPALRDYCRRLLDGACAVDEFFEFWRHLEQELLSCPADEWVIPELFGYLEHDHRLLNMRQALPADILYEDEAAFTQRLREEARRYLNDPVDDEFLIIRPSADEEEVRGALEGLNLATLRKLDMPHFDDRIAARLGDAAIVTGLTLHKPRVRNWKWVASLPQLRELYIYGGGLGGAGEQNLRKLTVGPSLKLLHIASWKDLVSTEGIQGSRNLQGLSLDDCPALRCLDGVHELPLDWFYARGCPELRDVSELEQLSTLRRLDITESSLEKADICKLRRALSNATLNYSIFDLSGSAPRLFTWNPDESEPVLQHYTSER